MAQSFGPLGRIMAFGLTVLGLAGASLAENLTTMITYPSTVSQDAAGPLALKAELNYDAARHKTPIAVVMHGYSTGVDNVERVRPAAQRLREAGFFAISVAMRGRDGSAGQRDSGGVEIYDIYDAIEFVKARYSDYVDADNVHITGYSGGGGNALSCLTHFPDYFRVGSAFFGMSDYGYDPKTGWYACGASASNQAQLRQDIGDPQSGTPAVLDRYQARAAVLGAGNNPYSEIHLFANADEKICPPIHLQRFRDAAAVEGQANNVQLHIGGPDRYEDFNHNGTHEEGEEQNWPHGVPKTRQQRAAESWYLPRLLRGEIPQPTLRPVGTLFVGGFVRTKPFSLWLGDGQNAAGECAYRLAPEEKRFNLQLLSDNRRVTGRLTVNTADMQGKTVELWLNARLAKTFTAEQTYTHENLAQGDTLILKLPAPAPARILNIRDYGAKGEPRLDTAAIQAAIDACNQAGGGVVEVPAGRWLSGTLVLKSNVTLRLAEGATIVGSEELKDYPLQRASQLGADCVGWKGERFGQALIYAHEAQNIAVEGPGVFDGQAWAFPTSAYPGRPRIVQFVSCRNARVQDITTRNGASWTQHYIDCDDLVLRDVTVCSVGYRRNNDGIDLESCRDVIVTGCKIYSGDDAFVIKGVSDRESYNILIIGCEVVGEKAAAKLGTESRGHFRNITVRDLRAAGTCGIGIHSVDRAVVENFTVMDVALTDAYATFSIRLGNRDNYRPAGEEPKAGAIRGVWIDGIKSRVAAATFVQLLKERDIKVEYRTNEGRLNPTGSYICGIPGSVVQNVNVRNVEISVPGGGTEADTLRTIPENTGSYPGTTTFGKLPAYGIYLRHVQGVRLENIRVTPAKPDARPAVAVDEDVQELTVEQVDGRIEKLSRK